MAAATGEAPRGPSPVAPGQQEVTTFLTQGDDWTCHEKNLITFHDLNDNFNPLLNIIDEGTIEEFDTDGFFLIDSDHENVFRGLERAE